MKDFLGQDIKVGDNIIYVTSNSGRLQEGVVLGFKDDISRHLNRSVIKKVHVRGKGNTVSGFTYPDRLFVICTK